MMSLERIELSLVNEWPQEILEKQVEGSKQERLLEICYVHVMYLEINSSQLSIDNK